MRSIGMGGRPLLAAVNISQFSNIDQRLTATDFKRKKRKLRSTESTAQL
ncbi:hypothetical protein PROFUN_14982 [Planoprotostelium fungivorum]|uniref:Uncharacterized protein n=1 Tax=Planoprotostelium fungivorum TaxID=1890364 RepID=A0A2P6MY33_9EUKA|nr:hypothetical protein PROFUN_14982 [Planoprotostelium fungivorum]